MAMNACRGCRAASAVLVLLALAGARAALALLADSPDELTEIVVEGRGPRFVAPTQRDQIGRIWAPAYINGRGPFRLVLDTGASRSCISAELAELLGLPLDASPPVRLHGVTGSATVPTTRIKTLTVGELTLDGPLLPIVPDAMGGAEGILGTKGLTDKRVLVDFRNDRILITFARGERAGRDFQIVPFHPMGQEMIVVNALVGDIPAKAIIDTGGQGTIGNMALHDALANERSRFKGKADKFQGATMEVQDGELIATPDIVLGELKMRYGGVTYADAAIFAHWNLTHQPAILIGMDALGLLDTMIIDFKRQELQLKMPKGG